MKPAECTGVDAMNLASKISDVVSKHGVAAVFQTYATTVYDEATGKATRGAATSHTVTVSPPNADGGVVKRFGNIDGVKESELFAIVAASGLTCTPDVGQEFIWDSKTWSVTWVNPIRSKDGVLAYQFGIKGAQ